MAVSIGIWAVAVGLYDAATARIPNGALLLGLALAVLSVAAGGRSVGGAGAGSCVLGFALGGLLALPGYLSAMMGAGDVKLAAVLGAMFGLTGIVWLLLLAAVLLGLYSALAAGMLQLRGAAAVRGRRLPAAPALVVAGMLVWLGLPAYLMR